MSSLKYTTLVLVMVQLCALAKAHCKFTDKNVENETRLVAIHNGGHYEIFNEDKVPFDRTLYFICSERDVVAVKCNRNKRFSRTLPINDCDKPPKAIVQAIEDNTCRAQTYRVGFEFRGDYLEIYRSCFDKEQMRTLVTSHIGSPNSIDTKRPSAPFTRDGIVTVKDVASYQAKSIFQRFKEILGQNQNYIKSQHEIIIDRGHLVPSADFFFDSNMNATFKYINIIPQFSAINRGNWKTVENYIRNRIDETGKGRIWTGSFDVLELKDQNNNQVPIFLQANHKNPIPKWIFKILSNEAEAIVFLTYNNIFVGKRPRAACKTITCPINLKNSSESGFTFCCDPNDFFRNVFPHLN